MRIVAQRVTHASVTIDGKVKSEIGLGMLVLLGIEEADTQEDVDWLCQKLTKLRIPAAAGEYRRAELRSPDLAANPYLAFALMIYAGLDGIRNGLALCEPSNINFYAAEESVLSTYEKLPESFAEACAAAASPPCSSRAVSSISRVNALPV